MKESEYLEKYFPEVDIWNDDLDTYAVYRAKCPCGEGEVLHCEASYSHFARGESWDEEYYVFNCEKCSKKYTLEEKTIHGASWHEFKVNGTTDHTILYLRDESNPGHTFKLHFESTYDGPTY